jgi:hypothetical protein
MLSSCGGFSSIQYSFMLLQRLDSRGHRVRTLKQLRLTPVLEVSAVRFSFYLCSSAITQAT